MGRPGSSQHSVPSGCMLFRMLVVGTTVVSFAASQGNQAAILATAAAAGAVWARCGADGKDGRSHKTAHFADSRVHRLGREAGFRRPSQVEIDADPRSREVYAWLRSEVRPSQPAPLWPSLERRPCTSCSVIV